MPTTDPYAGREQTQVKHYILKQYLVTLAHKVASFCDTFTYVDCFSGPWNVVSEDFGDASFAIAIAELRKARETYEAKRRTLKLRCFFVEKDPASYAKLRSFADANDDVDIKTKNARFEASVAEIVTFVKNGGPKNFTFIFIDPTGWTGFSMETIRPLLELPNAEILVNFMTSHIRRFIDSKKQATQKSFEQMFGTADFREKVAGLHHSEKEDALIGEYAKNLRKLGKFPYVAAAIILDPLISRTHFHLVYATRHPIGLQVFKNVEKQAMEVMKSAQAEAQHTKRQEAVPQGELFGTRDLYNPHHFDSLRQRYLALAKARLLKLLKAKKTIPYELAWQASISLPLVWESDLKDWIKEWQKDGSLAVDGLSPGRRVPQFGQNHSLRVKSSS